MRDQLFRWFTTSLSCLIAGKKKIYTRVYIYIWRVISSCLPEFEASEGISGMYSSETQACNAAAITAVARLEKF